MDWGPEFASQHSATFPDFAGSGLTVNIGWLGLQHILANGGSGYFPERLVADHLSSGRLYRLREASTFSLPAYLVYPSKARPATIGRVIGVLRAFLRDTSSRGR
ncbi:MAG: hypothetical protein AB7I04_19775 [Pseudomonadales bacterium]